MAELCVHDPRWYEFVDKLYDITDWRENPEKPGTYMWKCGKDGDRLYYAKQVAREMGFDTVQLAGTAAHCDCEIIFNLDDRPEDDDGT
jgi:hypothetical protein